MKHIPKDQCGIKDYQCVGLQHYIQQTLITCSSADLDTVGAPAQYKAHDQIANNFHNIPRSFVGVVNSTTYRDLHGAVDQYIGQCCTSYDVFSQSGFSDYYGKIGANTLAVSPLCCYYNAGQWVQQAPGVLLPVATLSQFNPSPVLTVPSWVGIFNTVVATQSKVDSIAYNVSQRIAKALSNANSGCTNGFGIEAYIVGASSDLPMYSQVKGSFSVRIQVAGGSVSCGQTWSNIEGSGLQTFSFSVETGIWTIDVYANLQFDPLAQTYTLRNYAMISQASPAGPIPLYLGSVVVACYKQPLSKAEAVVRIQQAACSPVMLCDPDHKKTDLPDDSSDHTVYVWAYKTSSNKLGWLPVVDC